MKPGRLPERLIRRLIVRSKNLLHTRVRELLDDLDLYLGQPFVLEALWEKDGVTQSDLADQLNRTPSTITKKIQRMEKAGFVKRRADDIDERVSRVFLTKAGRDIRKPLERVWEKFDAQVFAGFKDTELATLQGLLDRVCENLESISNDSVS